MRRLGWVPVVLSALLVAAPAAAAPEGQLTWGVHITLVPAYFDPAETTIGTSFMVLYGLHDALVKLCRGAGGGGERCRERRFRQRGLCAAYAPSWPRRSS